MFSRFKRETGTPTKIPYIGKFRVMESKKVIGKKTHVLAAENSFATFLDQEIIITTKPGENVNIKFTEAYLTNNSGQECYVLSTKDYNTLLIFPGELPQLNMPVLVMVKNEDEAIVMTLHKSLFTF